MEDLKRCPFCGSLPITRVYVSRMGTDGDSINFDVKCEKCGAYKSSRLNLCRVAPYVDVEKAMNTTIEKWNMRIYDGT